MGCKETLHNVDSPINYEGEVKQDGVEVKRGWGGGGGGGILQKQTFPFHLPAGS